MQTDKPAERDGVVIDVAPEAEPPPSAPDSPPVPKSGKSGRGTARIALFLAALTLLAVGAALLLGFQHWQAMRSDLSLLDAQLQQTSTQNQALQATVAEAAIRVSEQQRLIEEQANALNQTFERHRSALQQQQTALTRQAEDLAERKLYQDERESRVRATLADLHRRIGNEDTAWISAEAEYLVRMADQRLRLTRDVDTARSALELADRRLGATGDLRWSRIRARIAGDISALKAIRLPDLAGVSARLAAQIEAVSQLRLTVTPATLSDRPPADETLVVSAPDTTGEEPQSSWRVALDDLWQGMRDSVRVQRLDRPVAAVPVSGQRDFLFQNLKLNLESARLALVSGADSLYRDSLANSLDSLQRHFDPTDPATRTMQTELQALMAVDIRPALPDLSSTLHALQSEQARHQTTPATPSETAPPNKPQNAPDRAPSDVDGEAPAS